MSKNSLQDILDRSRKHRKENTKLDDASYVSRTLSIKAYWDGLDPEIRKDIGNKISNSKLTITEEIAKEIWSKVWAEDRGYDLYKKLAKEYNCAIDAVATIAHGTHFYSNISKEEYNSLLENWHKQFGYNKHIYIIRSPGNDLLSYYDEQNLLRGGCKISKLAPSEIFEIRFRWADKSRKKIKEYCDSKGIKVDGSMYDTYRDKTMSWLVDEPHQEWEFDNFIEMSKWICDRVQKPFKGGGQIAHGRIEHQMVWSDKSFNLSGWSFIKK